MKLEGEIMTLVRNRMKERSGLKTNLLTLMRQQFKFTPRSSSTLGGGQADN